MEQGEETQDGSAYVFARTFWRVINNLRNQIANLPSGGGAKTNIAASDPTVNDDSSQGYSVFSEWLNTSTNTLFKCVDSSVGAAQWYAIAFL